MTLVLIGNQKDKEYYREVSVEVAEAFRRKHQISFFAETSAKSGENVELIFLLASKLLYVNNKDMIRQMVMRNSLLTLI